MNRKHICFFIGTISNKGGTEKMSTLLANYLVTDSYKVSIISLTPVKKLFFEIDKNISIYSILSNNKRISLKWPIITCQLYRIVKREKIDIVIDVDIILSLFSLPLKIFDKNLKIISWEHFNYKTNLGVARRDYARTLAKRFSDAIVTLTDQDRAFYLESGNLRSSVYTISNFLNEIPAETSTLENKIAISVGRFMYQKGFDILVDVWNTVKQNPITKDWILYIIGDGEDKDKIRTQIKNLNLETSIKIIDAKENISEYYLNASLYLMTSRFEGLPMVLIEAKAYGLPIIAFDCITGPGALIDNGVDGYLIDMNNHNLMVDKICSYMSDIELQRWMGRKSKENSVSYSKSFVIQKWKSLLESL